MIRWNFLKLIDLFCHFPAQAAATTAPSFSDSEYLAFTQNVKASLIEPRLNVTQPCPLGFICDGGRQANCTKIRAVPVAFLFGDVHAGGYCPLGSTTMILCPVGHYCPTPEIMLLCPEGYFCPHKTAIPEIVCQVRPIDCFEIP